MKKRRFARILISLPARESQVGNAVCRKFASEIPLREYETDHDVLSSPDVLLGGSLVVISRPESGWISKANHGLLFTRANEYYIHPFIGCRFGCTYCYLQSHPVGRLPMRLHTDLLDLERSILRCVEENGIGLLFSSGELADSLADQDVYPICAELIRFFSELRTASLELRTKSVDVEGLVRLRHNQNAVIAFSLMPNLYSSRFEPGTPSISQRLNAACVLSQSGYPVAVNLEPLIIGPNWQDLYEDLVRKIKTCLESTLHHISIGSLRWNDNLKRVPAFSRDYLPFISNCSTIEYRPHSYNETFKLEERLSAYRWISGCLSRHGLGDIEIIWSMEEPAVIAAL